MPNDEGSAANESVAQDTTAPASATEETTSLEVVTEGPELNPNDYREDDEGGDDPDAGNTDEPLTPKAPAPQGGEKPLSPKSENRFQRLANENRILRERLSSVSSREAQIATEQELLNEVNPETGDYYTPAEAERIARQQSLKSEQSRARQESYNIQVQQNQLTIDGEAAQVMEDFDMFNPSSTEFNKEAHAEAVELLESVLIRDPRIPEIDPQTGRPTGKGMVIGTHASPYKIFQTVANAYRASAVTHQIKGQKATERMLSEADSPTGTRPANTNTADDSKLSADEYAKKHNLKPVW